MLLSVVVNTVRAPRHLNDLNLLVCENSIIRNSLIDVNTSCTSEECGAHSPSGPNGLISIIIVILKLYGIGGEGRREEAWLRCLWYEDSR
jgi:hypothetical protein